MSTRVESPPRGRGSSGASAWCRTRIWQPSAFPRLSCSGPRSGPLRLWEPSPRPVAGSQTPCGRWSRLASTPNRGERMVTLVIESMTRRFLDLAIERLRAPPAPWAWLSLGTAARREQGIVTDQDHALALTRRERRWTTWTPTSTNSPRRGRRPRRPPPRRRIEEEASRARLPAAPIQSRGCRREVLA
jgi:Putative nucleotidyltransferase DUF294